VEHEPFDDFELELKQAFERRPAPPSLKRKLMAARAVRTGPQAGRNSFVPWQRLAASIVLIATLGGGFAWRQHQEEQRKGEEAREQVLTALRITGHALDHVQSQLAVRNRDSQGDSQ